MTADSEWDAAFSQLESDGVHVVLYPDTASALYIHAKVIDVDGTKAFLGSENFSTASLDYNRELGLITSAAGVLGPLNSTLVQRHLQRTTAAAGERCSAGHGHAPHRGAASYEPHHGRLHPDRQRGWLLRTGGILPGRRPRHDWPGRGRRHHHLRGQKRHLVLGSDVVPGNLAVNERVHALAGACTASRSMRSHTLDGAAGAVHALVQLIVRDDQGWAVGQHGVADRPGDDPEIKQGIAHNGRVEAGNQFDRPDAHGAPGGDDVLAIDQIGQPLPQSSARSLRPWRGGLRSQ